MIFEEPVIGGKNDVVKWKTLSHNGVIFQPLYEKHNIPFTEDIYHDIHILKNKLSLLSKDDKCPICYDHTKCIPLECCHYLCVMCYCKLYKEPCPVCRL